MPILLQIEPDDILRNLGNLVYVVIFIAAALVPIVKGIREAAKKKQERDTPSSMSGPAEVQSKPQAMPQGDLESRVRRYFDEMAGKKARPATKPAEPAPAAARQPPPLPPAAREESLVEIEHLDTHFEGLHTQLKQIDHLQRSALPSRAMMARKSRGRQGRKGRKGRGSRRVLGQQGMRSIHHMLHDPGSLRQAILLREILGPPKALE